MRKGNIEMKSAVLYSVSYFVLFFALSALLSYDPVYYVKYFFDNSPLYLYSGISVVAAFSISLGMATAYALSKFGNLMQGKRRVAFHAISIALFVLTFVLTLITVSFNIFSYVSMNGFIYTLLSFVLSGITIPLSSFLFISLYDSVSAGLSAGGFGSLLLSLGCPSCGSLIYSLIGIGAGLSIFPFKGLELKLLSLVLLTYAAFKAEEGYYKACKTGKRASIGFRISWPKGTDGIIAAFLAVYAVVSLFTTLQISSIAFASGNGAKIDADITSLDSTAKTLITVFPELRKAKTEGDVVSILVPRGTPEYSEVFGGISYDDPVSSLNKLARIYPRLKQDVKGDSEAWKRYLNIAAAPRGVSCEFCCGVGAQGITANGDLRCGCSHNVALQSLALGLVKYTDYSDAEILREVMKWKTLFFPRNMVALAAEVSGKDPSEIKSLPGMVGGC